jgi:DNA-binding SARP family transcriptional activator
VVTLWVVRVALLGPLLVVDDEGVGLPVPARKERAVLAVLALRAGSVVQPEELVDALWGQDPPRSASKTVQTYVSSLRRLLPVGVIETVAGGYRLSVGRLEVDVARFARLLGAGGQAMADNQLREAVAALLHWPIGPGWGEPWWDETLSPPPPCRAWKALLR